MGAKAVVFVLGHTNSHMGFGDLTELYALKDRLPLKPPPFLGLSSSLYHRAAGGRPFRSCGLLLGSKFDAHKHAHIDL